jgi:1-acyl-sn-glycerol-3-phosphate acyltransferase
MFRRLAPISFLIRVLYRVSGVLALPPRSVGGTIDEKTREILNALERGDPVLIFPEGHVRRGAEAYTTGFARGVVHVHRRSRAPVVPVAIQLGSPRRLRQPCLITFGEPVCIPEALDLEAGAAWLRERTLALQQAGPGADMPKRKGGPADSKNSYRRHTRPRRFAHGTRTH